MKVQKHMADQAKTIEPCTDEPTCTSFVECYHVRWTRGSANSTKCVITMLTISKSTISSLRRVSCEWSPLDLHILWIVDPLTTYSLSSNVSTTKILSPPRL